jgi:PAS domain-containing protein
MMTTVYDPDDSFSKKKKTSRACIHCQKSHVTCDEGRPCKRCIKRNRADSCRDGVRKKAKYLTEDYDLRPRRAKQLQDEIKQQYTLPLPLTPPEGAITVVGNFSTEKSRNNGSTGGPNAGPIQPLQSRYDFNLDYEKPFLPDLTLSSYGFDSKTANLEYSILSNMLDTAESVSPPLSTDIQLSESSVGTSASSTSVGLVPEDIPRMIFPSMDIADYVTERGALDDHARDEQENLSSVTAIGWQHPEEVYEKVVTPFPYTQGFHALIAYLKSRFDRRHLIHMARAMAAYRPSFIATTKRLKESDLIFMEKCFQRTLLEFEKIIAASGTPTIVWRRTGQIAAVGKEFCQLTGWPAEKLVTNTTFIVELMDDKSVTAYFDVFSKLAFGDSRGVTMTECTLLRPSGEKIPTACTWTVKRDVFDIPMMIIGNFLPILH